MKRRAVVFRPLAREDINKIYDNLAERVSELSAFNYVNRILSFCEKLDLMPERGRLRDEVVADMRTIIFQRKITIAYIITDDEVVIFRIFVKGEDWETKITPP